jgi:hypothetical protein
MDGFVSRVLKSEFRKSMNQESSMLSIAPRAALAVAFFVLLLGLKSGHAQDAKPLVLTGELTKKDPFDKKRKASHQKVHELELKAGATYMIDLRSIDFDTFLRLENAAGNKISENDDLGDADANSRLGFVPKKTGTYRAVVTTSEGEQTGRYTLYVGTLNLKQAYILRIFVPGGDFALGRTVHGQPAWTAG